MSEGAASSEGRRPKASNAQSRCAPARCAGARAERPVAGWEDSDSGVARSTRSTSVVLACNTWSRAGQHPHAASHIIGRTDNAMIKIALTKAPTSLLECAVYISARKKLIHAMSRDIDRPIIRAVVVGCAISATRNHL